MMAEIEHRPVEVLNIFNRYAGEPVPADTCAPSVSDRGELTQADKDLCAKIRGSKQGDKFSKLNDGDWKGDYPSQSEADLAFCLMLAFWCGKDFEQIDRIFHQSGLYRPKWDEKHGQFTYGAITVGKAIAGTDKVYGDCQTQTKKESKRRVFSLVRAGMLKCIPPQWLIKDLLEIDSLALLFSDPGVGKTLWVVALGLSVVTGTSFYGRSVKQGPVILIVGEGFNGLVRRLMAWSTHNQVSYENAPLFISEMPAALTDAEMLAQVQDAIKLATAKHGPPVLIVIDTLARNFGPGDENSTQDMSQFIQAVDALRSETKAAILIVHHSGHTDKGRARGAMALKGALDAEFRLDKDEAGVIRMEATKMKDAKCPEPAAYQIKPVSLPVCEDDGTPIFSAVLVSTSYSPPTQKGKAGQGKHQTKALFILQGLQNEKREILKDVGNDPATARISTEEWRVAMRKGGIPQQRVAEVVASLRALNMITERGGYVSPL